MRNLLLSRALMGASFVGVILLPLSAAPVPVEELFQGFAYNRLSLSPDGSKIATIFPHSRERDYASLGLAVSNLDTGESKILHRNPIISVIDVDWASDDRMLTTLFGGFGRLGLFGVNADGSDLKTFVKPGEPSLMLGAYMISAESDRPGEVLMARRKQGDRYEKRGWQFDGRAPLPGVYRLNTQTGEHGLVVGDPGWTTEWFADPKGRVRVAYGIRKDFFRKDGRVVNYRAFPERRIFWLDDAGNGKALEGIAMGPGEGFDPLGFDHEGRRFLFAGRQGRDRIAVWAYDPATQQVEGPVYEHPVVDVGGAVLTPHHRTVAGVWVVDGPSRIEWLDPLAKELAVEVDAALPGMTNQLISWGRDRRRLLVLSSAAHEPGRYLLFDRTKQTLSEVYRPAAWLKGARFGRTEPIALKSRDGETLHGYLTRPPEAPIGKALPMVLYVHGGPWHNRDEAVFDPVVQFFATRGYAVLQVNFRGSSGYGRRFAELAKFQFGGTMQLDLVDAVDWAVAQGHADPRCLVVAGASYGGYATLMELSRAPGRFKAGVALFPVTDLVKQIEDYNRESERDWDHSQAHEWWKAWVGDPAVDAKRLAAASPIHQVGRLKDPLFIVYGEDDERISYRQSADYVRELRKAKKTFVRFAPPKEGHGLYREANRYKVFEALEQFLAQHAPLPGGG